MKERTIREIRRIWCLPASVSDEEIAEAASDTLLEARINLAFAIDDFKDAVRKVWRNDEPR